MDGRHNSGPGLPVSALKHWITLAERYKAAVHPVFNTYETRLQSFDCGWPDGRPDDRLLRAAEIFYTGTDLTITAIVHMAVIHYTHKTSYLTLEVLSIKAGVFTAAVH
jgi:hypothetical protein